MSSKIFDKFVSKSGFQNSLAHTYLNMFVDNCKRNPCIKNPQTLEAETFTV